ncbi:MAG TPA: hypothetical protein VN622_03165 [Clostridia bacterium]|nr:hypothetical protein [Clostridia bacterium]
MNRRAYVVAIVLVLLLGACRREGEHKPSKLIAPLYSGQSLQTAQRVLELEAGNWDVLEDRRPLPSDKRPPFRIFTISKKNWPHNASKGELVMTFFNDRLMTTQFYTDNLEQFKAALQGQDSLIFSEAGDTKIEPSTRVWIGKDASGRRYVGWIDKVLQREHDDWVSKYAQS